MRSRISRTKSSKSVSPSQPQVGRHPIVDKIKHQDQIHNPDQWCTQILILGYWNTLILYGNNQESKRVNIFTCYIDSKQRINHLKTTNCHDIYSQRFLFTLLDPDQKSQAKCLHTQIWSNQKVAIKENCSYSMMRSITIIIPSLTQFLLRSKVVNNKSLYHMVSRRDLALHTPWYV